MSGEQAARVIYLMGVSGSGKTTVGRALSAATGIPFVDGDDFHPPANIRKMAAGQPLNDADRQGWLKAIQAFAKKETAAGRPVIIACSALKQRYRQLLSTDIPAPVYWACLEGSYDLIKSRMDARKGHFMPPGLLQSQFDDLEPPQQAVILPVAQPPEQLVAILKNQLDL